MAMTILAMNLEKLLQVLDFWICRWLKNIGSLIGALTRHWLTYIL